MSTDDRAMRYGRYTMIARTMAGVHRAVGYIGKRRITEATGDSIQSARENLRAELAARDRVEIEKRVAGVPTAVEYQEALEVLADKITDAQRAMLKAHYHAKKADVREDRADRTLTVIELAKAAGFPDFGAANLQYGLLGRKVAEQLGYKPPIPDDRDDTVWTFALATGVRRIEGGLWEWTLRPEVADALHRAGMV